MPRYFSFFFLFGILVSSVLSFSQAQAAGTIPRDGLRLELLLATGAQDTSGNNRPVTATGVAPSYQVDPVYGVPYAQFSGSGGLRVNTAWSAGASDDFTVSMWVRVKKSELPVVNGVNYPDYSHWLASVWWSNQLSTQYFQTLFTTQSSFDQTALSLSIRSDYKCGLGGVKNLVSWYGVYIQDPLNNPYSIMDCSTLKDEKWHFIVMNRYIKTLSISIDGIEIYKAPFEFPLNRIISLGNSIITADTGARLYQIGADPYVSYNQTYFKSSLNGFRLYNRSLSAIELGALQNEFLYSQSDLTNIGDVNIMMNKYVKPNLIFYIKKIPLSLDKNQTTFQYSLDGKTYINFDESLISDISTGTGYLDYKFTIDASDFPNGKVILYLRASKGNSQQLLGSIAFQKDDIIYEILINQPSTIDSESKTISATTSFGGIISISITRGNICDASLKFDDYTDLVFTTKADNFTRVCYRAFFLSTNKTIYKLSDPIQGIASSTQAITSYKLFDDYLSWIKSTYIKPNDSTSLVLDLLSVGAGQSQGTINGITMTDINGDGLVDFLYSRNDPIRRAILINNGNYTFKTVYKCAIDGILDPWGRFTGAYNYYGDCADPTR